MFGPMTSSPKRRGKQKEGAPRLPPSVSDSIWCGDEKVEEEGSRCDNNDQVRMRRREEEGIVKSEPAPVMMRLEEELKELASGGRTKDLLHLLEEGAPFVVDMVSHNPPMILQNMSHSQALVIIFPFLIFLFLGLQGSTLFMEVNSNHVLSSKAKLDAVIVPPPPPKTCLATFLENPNLGRG